MPQAQRAEKPAFIKIAIRAKRSHFAELNEWLREEVGKLRYSIDYVFSQRVKNDAVITSHVYIYDVADAVKFKLRWSDQVVEVAA